MADVADVALDAQPNHKLAETQKSDAKSAGTEEAEKAGASESKHNEEKAPSDDAGEAGEPKLDELSSLEQEIAKMHNIQHGTETGLDEDEVEKTTAQLKDANGSKAENGSGSSSHDAQAKDELELARRCTPVNKVQSKEEPVAAAALEDVDLIALLKGTDQEQEPPAEPAKAAIAAVVQPKSRIEVALSELDNVGVTIEGEGQYEIMEIDDGDNVSGTSPEMLTAANSGPTVSKTGAKFGKPKLSPEQARAVALEQMADLKAQKARRKDQASAPIKQQQPHDIISSLNDDWNEYDSGSDNASNTNSNATANANTLAMPATKKPLVKKPKSALDTTHMVGSVKVMLKSVTQKSVEQPKAAVEQLNSNAETTGFKRTRVIKRKIIWDPDVPETQKSFAQYASSKSTTTTLTTATATATAAVPATTPATATTTTTALKSNNTETASKKARPPTPKEPLKVAIKRTATPSKPSESPPKRHSQTPSIPNGVVSMAKKKKVSEIDRLMGDEGAANMMQAVEREQRELSGGETANKPLMRKRAMTLTGRKATAVAAAAITSPTAATAAVTTAVETTSTPTKKESPPKASKRAAANNATDVETVFDKPTKSRASDSWDYVYKQRASEESMIMRRRSNSSYSSNASVSRLSLDNKPGAGTSLSDEASDALALDPSFIFLKPENKANQRSDGSTPHTLTNDLKRSAQQQPKEPKAAKVELVALHKLEKLTHLVINAQLSKTGYTYKLQLLQKLNELLNKLAKANDCNTVLLTVQGQQFCQGIDCQDLMAGTVEKRKSNATQLALVLKTYLRTLATFPKPLVAGIVGNVKNLGIMQLPLFDFVLAADDCCFETNYAKLGQLPEGYTFWQKHPKVPTQLHSRLFLLGERLDTADLVDSPSSFIDRTCKPRNVNDEALAVAKLISSTTAEHYRSLKKLNQTGNAASLQRLDAEFKIITDQWSSANFQASYKRYINDAEF